MPGVVKLYCQGLTVTDENSSFFISNKSLNDLASEHGEMARSFRAPGENYAFIFAKTKKDADKITNGLHMKCHKGQTLRLQVAHSAPVKFWVGGVPEDLKESELSRLFEDQGVTVLKCDILYNKKIAFVYVETNTDPKNLPNKLISALDRYSIRPNRYIQVQLSNSKAGSDGSGAEGGPGIGGAVIGNHAGGFVGGGGREVVNWGSVTDSRLDIPGGGGGVEGGIGGGGHGGEVFDARGGRMSEGRDIVLRKSSRENRDRPGPYPTSRPTTTAAVTGHIDSAVVNPGGPTHQEEGKNSTPNQEAKPKERKSFNEAIKAFELKVSYSLGCSLGENLTRLVADGRYIDTRISCNGTSFKCHALVLCAKSSKFSELLRIQDTVEMHEFDPVVVNALLQFMYSGSIELSDTLRDIAENIVLCARSYMIGGAVDAMIVALAKSLTVGNVIFTLELAFQLDIPELKDFCSQFIVDNKYLILADHDTKTKLKQFPDVMLEIMEAMTMM